MTYDIYIFVYILVYRHDHTVPYIMVGLLHMDLSSRSARLGTSVSWCCSLWLKLPWSWIAVGCWLCCCCRCSWEAKMVRWSWKQMVMMDVFRAVEPHDFHVQNKSCHVDPCSSRPGFQWPATAFSRKLEWWWSRLSWWLGPSLPARRIRSTNSIVCADWLGKLSCRWKQAMQRRRCWKMGPWLLNRNFSQDDLRTKGRFQALYPRHGAWI